MAELIHLFSEPSTWAALATLTVMEVVLGVDNLIFISVLSNKLPLHQQATARRIGITAALAFSILVEGLNMMARRARQRKAAALAASEKTEPL